MIPTRRRIRRPCRLVPVFLLVVLGACTDRPSPTAAPPPVEPPAGLLRAVTAADVAAFTGTGLLAVPATNAGTYSGAVPWTDAGGGTVPFGMWVHVRTVGTVSYTLRPEFLAAPCLAPGCWGRVLLGEGEAGGAGYSGRLEMSVRVRTPSSTRVALSIPSADPKQREWLAWMNPGDVLEVSRGGMEGGTSTFAGAWVPGYAFRSNGSGVAWTGVLPVQVTPSESRVLPGDTVTATAAPFGPALRVTDWFFSDRWNSVRLDACRGALTCRVAVPRTGRISVYGMAGNYAFSAQTDTIRAAPPEFFLRCNSARDSVRMVRGEGLTCTAVVEPYRLEEKTDSLRWTFTDAAGNVLHHADAYEWDGRMIVGGTITASARVDGVRMSARPIPIRVALRGWSFALPAMPVARPATNDARFPPFTPGGGTRHLLGLFSQDIDSRLISGEGPNQGWYAFGQVSWDSVSILIHPALFPGHAYYVRQASPRRGECTQVQLDTIRESSVVHEQAHYHVARAFFAGEGARMMDAAVLFDTVGTSEEDLRRILWEPVRSRYRALQDSLVDRPDSLPLPCVFRVN